MPPTASFLIELRRASADIENPAQARVFRLSDLDFPPKLQKSEKADNIRYKRITPGIARHGKKFRDLPRLLVVEWLTAGFLHEMHRFVNLEVYPARGVKVNSSLFPESPCFFIQIADNESQ